MLKDWKRELSRQRTEQGRVCSFSRPQFPESLCTEAWGSASRLSSECPPELCLHEEEPGVGGSEGAQEAWPKLLPCDLGQAPFPFTPWNCLKAKSGA